MVTYLCLAVVLLVVLKKFKKNQKLLIFGICNTSQQHINMFIQQTPWRYNDFIKDIPSIIFISSCIWINHLHVIIGIIKDWS